MKDNFVTNNKNRWCLNFADWTPLWPDPEWLWGIHFARFRVRHCRSRSRCWTWRSRLSYRSPCTRLEHKVTPRGFKSLRTDWREHVKTECKIGATTIKLSHVMQWRSQMLWTSLFFHEGSAVEGSQGCIFRVLLSNVANFLLLHILNLSILFSLTLKNEKPILIKVHISLS